MAVKSYKDMLAVHYTVSTGFESLPTYCSLTFKIVYQTTLYLHKLNTCNTSVC